MPKDAQKTWQSDRRIFWPGSEFSVIYSDNDLLMDWKSKTLAGELRIVEESSENEIWASVVSFLSLELSISGIRRRTLEKQNGNKSTPEKSEIMFEEEKTWFRVCIYASNHSAFWIRWISVWIMCYNSVVIVFFNDSKTVTSRDWVKCELWDERISKTMLYSRQCWIKQQSHDFHVPHKLKLWVWSSTLSRVVDSKTML